MTVGSCDRRSGAARKRCPCEGGSRRLVLEGGDGLMIDAEITKPELCQGTSAGQDGTPAQGERHHNICD